MLPVSLVTVTPCVLTGSVTGEAVFAGVVGVAVLGAPRPVSPRPASVGFLNPTVPSRRVTQRPALPGDVAFWVVAVLLFVLLLAAGAPSPLYRVYQAEWGFSATTLTEVFGVYALVLLVTLLFCGSLSDHVGRRPVIAAGMLIDAAACGVFLAATGVGALYVARALQGVAVGLATGALGAALLELEPPGSGRAAILTSAAPTAGLAVGALGTSALVQYGPAKTQLTWWLLLGAFLAAAATVLALPEPGRRRPGALASLRPRVGVPRQARGPFLIAAPCLVAVWALGGLYLSLGPSLAAQLLHSSNLMWGGVTIFLLPGTASVATVAMRNTAPQTEMLAGCLALLPGAAVTFVAIATRTSWAFLLGTAVAGVGFGPGFTGAYRIVVARSTAEGRAALIAAIFSVSYLAFSVPAVIAGVATTHYGLRDTALVFYVVIALLVATAAASLAVRRRWPGAPAPARADS
jgi:MFS family permease